MGLAFDRRDLDDTSSVPVDHPEWPRDDLPDLGIAQLGYDTAELLLPPKPMLTKERPHPTRCVQVLGGTHLILALNQAARIGPRHNVTKSDVLQQPPEERNPASNEHRDTSYDETINEPRVKESLNRDATVHVEVLRAASSEVGRDLGRRAAHLLHDASAGSRCRQVDGAATQNDDPLVTVWPRLEGQPSPASR